MKNRDKEKKEDEACVWKALREIYDPELSISIVKLGLIYDVILEGDKENDMYESIKIIMTFTTPMCPFADMLLEQVETQVTLLGLGKPEIEITFTPPWEPSDALKMEFGL